MIRINLLPFREARKKENIRRQISIYLLSVGLLLCLMVLGYLQLHSTAAALKAEKHKKTRELERYKDTNKRLAEIKKKISEIKTKLEVIRGLEKNKMGPVRLLDEVATAVPRDKLWLRSLVEKKGRLTLEGTAMDNETVALFMNNLEASPHIKRVDLKSTRLRVLKQYKLNLMDFAIDCKTYAFKEKSKRPKKKRRSRRGRRRKK